MKPLDNCGFFKLTSTSRLTTPVDLRLGFFLLWLDGCKVEDEVAEPAGVVLVVAVPLADEVIVTEGTSRFSMKKKS